MLHHFARTTASVLVAVALAGCESGPTDPAVASMHLSDIAAHAAAVDWHATARNLVAANNLNALVAGRLYAAVGMAQYRAIEAVGGTDATSRNDSGYGAGGRALYEARRGAVAGASVRVLSHLVPSAAAALEQQLSAQGSTHPQFARGLAIGRAAGDDMVQHLMNDGWTGGPTHPARVGPGFWTTAAPPGAGANLGGVTPYFLESASQFRPADPPAYLSPAFNADLAEALLITTTATAAQRANAIQWNYGANTYGPLGYWNELAGRYAQEAGMNEAEAAQAMALVSAAMFDALIACFEAKYYYYVLRPHQADPTLVSLFGVPNYPAYPSGHQSISSAAARVLTHFFPEHAAEIDALRAEASESRIIAGLHYRFDQNAATILGQQVGDNVIAKGM